jgi:hypothetical protein
MTPKQTLLAHLQELHKGLGSKHWTLERLQALHRRHHHELHCSHHHGYTSGPGDRPPGWTTGEGAVMRSR